MKAVVGWEAIAALGARAGGKARHLAEVSQALSSGEAVVLPGVVVPPGASGPRLAQQVVDALGGARLIVRSSARPEDGARRSLAGHFETQVCEATPAALAACIGTVRAKSLVAWETLLRRRGERREAARRRGARELALLVQPALEADRSGVLFTKSPLHPDRALVSAAFGTCHGVVDGTMPTDTFVLRGTTSEDSQVRFKFEQVLLHGGACGQPVRTPFGPSWVHLPYGPGLVTARVPRGRESTPCLSERDLGRVAAVGEHLERHFGRAMDVEFSFRGDTLFVLQARPITTRAPEKRLATPSGSGPQVASPGRAAGPLRRVWTVEDLGRVRRGDVVLVGATDPEFLPMFRLAAAVLSVEGSPLTHTAIVARELGVPCLVGVDETRDGPFVEGQRVTVDAHSGRVLHGRSPQAPRVATPKRARALMASRLLAEVAFRLGDVRPTPEARALAQTLSAGRRVTWDCAPTDSPDEREWRALFRGAR